MLKNRKTTLKQETGIGRRFQRKSRRGFSLVEMLIVVFIGGILTGGLLFVTQHETGRAELARSMDIFKEIETAMKTCSMRGVNVVVRPGDLNSGTNGSMNRADGMFESGQAEIEETLGYKLTTLPDMMRFVRITDSQTVDGETWTKDKLSMWRATTASSSNPVPQNRSAVTFAGVVLMNIKINGVSRYSFMEMSFEWDKWGTN